MPTPRYEFAPWVIDTDHGDKRYLLAPNLSVLEIPKLLNLCLLPRHQLTDFVAAGCLVEVGSFRETNSFPELTTDARGAVVSQYDYDAIHQLVASLNHFTTYDWGLVTSLDSICARPPEYVVILNTRDSQWHASSLTQHLSQSQIIWSGESLEGPHLGPVFRSAQDIERYKKGTFQWSYNEALRSFGIYEHGVSIHNRVKSDPALVAQIVSELLTDQALTCAVIDSDAERSSIKSTRKTLWPAVLPGTDAPCDLDAYRWSKGLFSRFEIERHYGCFFGFCSIPAGGDADLEVCGGKGLDSASAELSTFGEAIERFSAWLGDSSETPLLNARPDIAPERFHPFGSPWEDYIAEGNTSDASVKARDEATQGTVLLPADLCIDRSLRRDRSKVISGSSTSGLAAFTTKRGAVLRGALELIERDNFYVGLAHLQRGELIVPGDIPEDEHLPHLLNLISNLEDHKFRASMVRYVSDFDIPMVHTFLWDSAGCAMSRGSGSSASWALAATKSLMEAIQISLQHAFIRDHGESVESDREFTAWTRTDVTDVLRAHCASFVRKPIGSYSNLSDEDHLYRVIAETIKRNERGLYVVDLPPILPGWFAVRALIPGMAINATPSQSDGGRKLLGARFCHGVPI